MIDRLEYTLSPPPSCPTNQDHLSFCPAILHGLHSITARQRSPDVRSVSLDNHVRVHEHGAAMPDHDAS